MLCAYDKTIEACRRLWGDFSAIIRNSGEVEAEVMDSVQRALSISRVRGRQFTSSDFWHLVEACSRLDYSHIADTFKTLQVTAIMVLGCLNVNIIKTATLGSSLGDTANTFIDYYFKVLLKPFLPDIYWKILYPTFRGVTYSAVVCLALFW